MVSLLVGIDGHRELDPGLLWALGVAERTGAELRLVHVWRGPDSAADLPPGADPVFWYEECDKARRVLPEAISAARACAPVNLRRISERRLVGKAPLVLSEQSAGMDMVVLTRRHAATRSRVLHGSTAHALLGRGSAPVVVVPTERQSATPPRRVVAAVDPSSAALSALTWAGAQARALGVELLPVRVHSGTPMLTPELEASERTALTALCPPGAAPAEILVGRPGPSLVDFLEPDDLLVVGSRTSLRRGRLMGSTSNHVLERSPCPVVVVATPAR